MSEVDRRTLLLLLGGVAAAGMTGCGEPEPPRAALARVFGLQGEQVRWLDRLNDEQAAELWSALNSSSLATSRTVDLIARVLLPLPRAGLCRLRHCGQPDLGLRWAFS